MSERDRGDEVIWLRPERSGLGRPAERSRSEITGAALLIADAEGLEALSMRRVAAALGTGAASLYRYVATRDELLELMTDSCAAEYELPALSGDPIADVVEIGRQARRIMHRHRWLPQQIIAAAGVGPRTVDVMEYFLAALAGHPADPTTKLEAFALLHGSTALYVQHELGADPGRTARRARYLAHVVAAGRYPHLAAAVAAAGPPPRQDPQVRFVRYLTRVMTGLLTP